MRYILSTVKNREPKEPMQAAEQEWVAEYQRGNIAALGKLVEHFRPALYGYIMSMVKAPADAEEIFQDMWVRCIKHLPTWKSGHLRHWLARIAHNLVVDRIRQKKPILLDDLATAAVPDPLARVASAAPGPDREAVHRDLAGRIHAAIQMLPPEQREVFVMRTEADLPFKEIARIQKVSINTALARMQYALAKLRVELAAEYRELAGG